MLGFSSEATENKRIILKSFNFKVYYTTGGEKIANQIINQAESNLETMENFLGTRLVEQIDIFISEEVVLEVKNNPSKNGNIHLDNSSIYLSYSGNTSDLLISLKEQLAEILINGMLFGNTLKERLKNSREINVPNWYVTGLANYVAGGKPPDVAWMADYYDGKLKLNLNLTEKKELDAFGHAIFIHIYDSFGINKLRQLLFYTKLSGKAEFAFEYVLNKSLNYVLADWYKMEKTKYLNDNKSRLPNDPEPLGKAVQTSDIIDIKFNKESTELNFLIRTFTGIEIWNYGIGNRKTRKLFTYKTVKKDIIWAFLVLNDTCLLSMSNGINSKLFSIQDGRVIKTSKLEFSYIHSIKENPVSGLALLCQKNFQIDIFQHDLSDRNKPKQITENEIEETDFAFDKSGSLYVSDYSNQEFRITESKNSKVLYHSNFPILELNNYKGNYLSFLQKSKTNTVGMILNLNDTIEKFQVTNYKRSILDYDYNDVSKHVLEVLKYGKLNFLVISEASVERAKLVEVEKAKTVIEIDSLVKDTSKKIRYNYKFITGFEYLNYKQSAPKIEIKPEYVPKIKIKTLSAPQYEFKTSYLKIAITNTTFNSPLFASFYPINQGLYNGLNLILGVGIYDVNKKYFLSGHLRQPLSGKGTDFDFSLKRYGNGSIGGVNIFNSNYQKELYNQTNKFTMREIKFFWSFKSSPKVNLQFQAGYREDASMPLAYSIENLQSKVIKLRQPFINSAINTEILNRSKLNYGQKLKSAFVFDFYKPIGKEGINSNLFIKLKHEQLFFRIFKVNTEISAQSSVGKQKTVFLLGGVTNWIRPTYGTAPVYKKETIVMYSAMTDFAGLPYNYKAGTSTAVGKINLSFLLNPLLSQQNFNQNIYKFLTIRSYANLGTAWFGNNPFSIDNPDNKEIIDGGSFTITNYVAKNPLVWSWGLGVNSMLLGYEIGIDFSMGFNERGKIGNFFYFTIGKEF